MSEERLLDFARRYGVVEALALLRTAGPAGFVGTAATYYRLERQLSEITQNKMEEV